MGTTGEPKGVKTQGGLLEVITRAVEIECLPDEIPESFVVDVTELMIGQSKRFSDLPLTGSMKLISAPETVIAHVVTMRAEEVKPAPKPRPRRSRRAGRRAEPEVIKKGKKEEEAASRGERARRSSAAMFLVAGLGNPGEEYADTPHNLGFMVVDRLAEMHGIRVTRRIRRRWSEWGRSPAAR